jgi:hypothetical protein
VLTLRGAPPLSGPCRRATAPCRDVRRA